MWNGMEQTLVGIQSVIVSFLCLVVPYAVPCLFVVPCLVLSFFVPCLVVPYAVLCLLVVPCLVLGFLVPSFLTKYLQEISWALSSWLLAFWFSYTSFDNSSILWLQIILTQLHTQSQFDT